MPAYDHPDISSTRSAMAESVRRDRPIQYGLADLGGPIVAALVWLFLPVGVDGIGRIVGALVIGSIGLVDRVTWRLFPDRWANLAVIVYRTMVALTLAWTAPPVYHASMIVGTSLVLGSLHLETSRRVLSMTAGASAGFAIVGVLNDVPYWYLAVSMLAVTGVSSELWYRAWRSERTEIDRRHDEMFDRAGVFSWEVDARTGEMLSVAGAAFDVLGYTPEEMVGQSIFNFVHPTPDDQVVETFGVRSGGRHAEVRAIHRDGREILLSEVRVDEGSRVIRGVSVDVTELSAAKQALHHQAHHDPLTGLANRARLDEVLANRLDDVAAEPFALFVADLDRFKEINDTLGHPTGDRVLALLAHRFEEGLSDLDLVARAGGDEFAFVARLDGAADARAVAERIHDLATVPLEVDGLILAVACSIGVALAPAHGSERDELVKHADVAAYQCKRSGGGVQIFADEPDDVSRRRWQLLSEVAGAVDSGEIELFWQPVVELPTGRILGVEGLARWQHPELGMLLPDEFLHALEVAADYHRFTTEVIRQGVEFAAATRALGQPIDVSVNLSAMALLDRGLPDRVEALLVEHGVPGDTLIFEVSEVDLLDESGADAPVLAALASLGVRLSVDEFGTGRSTFMRLRALSIDEVKIDRTVIAGLGDSDEDDILVATIVRLCEVLGHEVVAEGVETLEQAERLHELGCRRAQGFLFACPMPRAAMLDKLVEPTTPRETRGMVGPIS